MVHDLETVWDGIKSIPDPIERKLNNFFPNPLTDTKQESYDAGYDSIKAVERVADIYGFVKGGAKLVRKLGKLGKEEASLSKGLKEAEEKKAGKGGTPGLFGDSAKADSALAKVGDGKFKTNAIRFPTNFESLGSYLQSVARKMNIRITKRSPIFATAGDHYRLHDPGPDVPHSKGSGAKISPERQKQIDALESGEYTGKSTKGTGEVPKFKLTEPSLPKGGKPKGNYGEGDSHGIKKQNETADVLADNGYDIEMLDEIDGGNGHGIAEGSNPDFLIEGNVFDCYAPKPDGKIQSIIKEIAGKTKKQSGRIVLNIDNFPNEKVTEIIETILRKANPNGDLKRLEELILVKDGKITRVFGG